MTTTYFTWLVLFGGLLVSGAGTLYLFMLFALFGAAAAVALPALGGATVTPVVLFVPLLFARMLQDSGWRGWWNQVAYPRAGFWLLLMALWGVLSAFVMPRLFMNEVFIRTVDRNSVELGTALVPLHPVSNNLTQSGYALGAVCVFVAVSVLLSERRRILHFRDAVLLLAALNCLCALVNIAELYFSSPPLLQYVRTANYAIFDGAELGGLYRLSGTFSEASTFSAFTLTLFAFTFSLWCQRVRSAYTGGLALTSLLLLLISTSATAYVGLALYAMVLALGWLWRRTVPRPGHLITLAWLAGVAICCILLVKPDLAGHISDFFNTTLFNKLHSDSGAERSEWNRQAWSNFLSTYGLGVGLGSAFASSYPLVLLSNIGIPGTACFVAFLYRALHGASPRAVASETAVTRAARQAVIAALIAATMSAAVFYIGMAFFAFAAAAQGRSMRRWQAGSSQEYLGGSGTVGMTPRTLGWQQVLASGQAIARPSSWIGHAGRHGQELF